MPWDCGMLVGLLDVWRNGYCSCWTTWPWYWVPQRVGVARHTSTTRVAKSVSSLLQRSPFLSADGLRQRTIWLTSLLVQNVTDRACLSAEAARVAGEEAPVRKRTRSRSCTGVASQNRGRTDTYPKSTRRRRSCASASPRCSGEPGLPTTPLRRVVLPRAEPSHRNHGAGLHRHAQQVSGLLRKDEGQAEAVDKVGRDGNARYGPS